MLHLDLFSGIGGFALAAKRLGFQTVGFSEIDPFCNKVLSKNFPTITNMGNIKDINYYDHVDLITGGFPCQPFSIAGKQRGKRDERYLWPEFLRVIGQAKPCWVVIENVVGSVAMVLDTIISDLETQAYQAATIILPACSANAPHRRDRVFIIAHRPSERCDCRASDREGRHLQDHWQWDLSQIHQEWEGFKRGTWKAYQVSHWLEFNARAVRGNHGLPRRLDKDRIKALGNAVVPQVVFPILAVIAKIHNLTTERG